MLYDLHVVALCFPPSCTPPWKHERLLGSALSPYTDGQGMAKHTHTHTKTEKKTRTESLRQKAQDSLKRRFHPTLMDKVCPHPPPPKKKKRLERNPPLTESTAAPRKQGGKPSPKYSQLKIATDGTEGGTGRAGGWGRRHDTEGQDGAESFPTLSQSITISPVEEEKWG